MKRTLDSFLVSSHPKKPRTADASETSDGIDAENASTEPASKHPAYPFPVLQYPNAIAEGLGFVPASEPRIINDQPDLDLAYFSPYIPSHIQKRLFEFLRRELFFYRVRYKINRGPVETQIVTPRYTTVFGIDATSSFSSSSTSSNSDISQNPADAPASTILDSSTNKPIPKDKYKCTPRPLPHCLDVLRAITEAATGETFNFCLVNYYASGADSISYHSDDERFLGPDPAIASLSLGATRDFLLKHKNAVHKGDAKEADDDSRNGQKADDSVSKPLKLALAGGDMVLMKGKTQSRWLHSIPKRRGPGSDGGRINITFRKALVEGGTENYYQYNVGSGGAYKWDESRREMMPWPRG